jgi:uncharacterized Zn finger protein (UPF0148 family)
MVFDIDALTCPNCGAPLNLKQGEEITFCQYCNSNVRISKHEETDEHTATHARIDHEIINNIRQLILEGKKAEAVEMYQNAAHIGKEEAERAIESVEKALTNLIILNRPLSAKGIFFASLFLVIIILSLYALSFGAAKGTFAAVLFWATLIFFAVTFLSLWRSIAATIKYFPRKWVKATILKFVMISQKKKFSFFKVLLDIKKPDGLSFRAETNIMMKTENNAKLQEGKTIDVKYIDGDKNSVLASVANL